jgi:CheY-like chemotaxis protein
MKRLLIVEDDASIRETLVDFFELAGSFVTAASDLVSARSAVQQGEFDIVLLDLLLPDGDGIELLRELRRAGNTTPVLILSARGEEAQRIHGLRQGADDYVVKPFSAHELALASTRSCDAAAGNPLCCGSAEPRSTSTRASCAAPARLTACCKKRRNSWSSCFATPERPSVGRAPARSMGLRGDSDDAHDRHTRLSAPAKTRAAAGESCASLDRAWSRLPPRTAALRLRALRSDSAISKGQSTSTGCHPQRRATMEMNSGASFTLLVSGLAMGLWALGVLFTLAL